MKKNAIFFVLLFQLAYVTGCCCCSCYCEPCPCACSPCQAMPATGSQVSPPEGQRYDPEAPRTLPPLQKPFEKE
jgi:hypothetical protein